MKIMGSGKIDDYKKVALEDSVLKAIEAKPGDSIIFYERHNDDTISICKSEGSTISTEADGPRRRHMREAFIRLRLFLWLTAVCMVVGLVLAVTTYSDLELWQFVLLFVLGILSILFIVSCIYLSKIVDDPYEAQALVSIGNAYSKNRIAGLSKVSTDGIVATTNLYINSLFGAKVEDVHVRIDPEGQIPFDAVVVPVKSVVGYSVYKVHIKDILPERGEMVVSGRYRYIGKIIYVQSSYHLEYDPKKKSITVTEGGVDAQIEFKKLNDTVFDENWMKESDEAY